MAWTTASCASTTSAYVRLRIGTQSLSCPRRSLASPGLRPVQDNTIHFTTLLHPTCIFIVLQRTPLCFSQCRLCFLLRSARQHADALRQGDAGGGVCSAAAGKLQGILFHHDLRARHHRGGGGGIPCTCRDHHGGCCYPSTYKALTACLGLVAVQAHPARLPLHAQQNAFSDTAWTRFGLIEAASSVQHLNSGRPVKSGFFLGCCRRGTRQCGGRRRQGRA